MMSLICGTDLRIVTAVNMIPEGCDRVKQLDGSKRVLSIFFIQYAFIAHCYISTNITQRVQA